MVVLLIEAGKDGEAKTRNLGAYILFFKGFVAGCHNFCLFFIFYNVHSFNQIHSIHLFVAIRPRSLSISSSLVSLVGKPPCGAEPRIELGPALQQADALYTCLD